jgi:hypothetical protein
MAIFAGNSDDPNVAAVRGDHTGGAAAVVGNSDEGSGVLGISDIGQGVVGISTSSAGVMGESKFFVGVKAISESGAGLEAFSATFEAIHAESQSTDTAAIAAFNTNPAGTGAAIFAKKAGNRGHAGFFDGKVFVTNELAVGGDIILMNADCAEEFEITDSQLVEPGTVMVLSEEGKVQQSQTAYDKRVAGVISGGGDYKPGIILDKKDSQSKRMPIALLGKVYCKVDASYAAIEVGDLLTTAPTPGYAMKADDPIRAFGAVIGKAMRPLASGKALIPILIALQ